LHKLKSFTSENLPKEKLTPYVITSQKKKSCLPQRLIPSLSMTSGEKRSLSL